MAWYLCRALFFLMFVVGTLIRYYEKENLKHIIHRTFNTYGVCFHSVLEMLAKTTASQSKLCVYGENHITRCYVYALTSTKVCVFILILFRSGLFVCASVAAVNMNRMRSLSVFELFLWWGYSSQLLALLSSPLSSGFWERCFVM